MRKKIIKIAANILIYILIVAGLIVGLPKFLSWELKTPYPMAAITSGSMWPALKEGELVFIQGVKKEEIKVGDIIVYRGGAGGGFVIHRVERLGEGTLITKGDANFTEDAPVKYENIVGRTLYLLNRPVHIPYLGSITVYASNLKK